MNINEQETASLDISKSLIDSTPPCIANSYLLEDDKLTFSCDGDKGTDYTIKVKGCGKSKNNIIDQVINTTITAGVKEFKYSITNNDSIIKEDTTTEMAIDLQNLESGKYNITIETVDYSGNISGVSNYEFQYDNPYSYYNSLIDNFLVLKGDISSNDIDLLRENIYKLPISLVQILSDANFTLCLTSEDIRKYYNGPVGGELSGLFDPNSQTLYVSNWVNYGYVYIDRATLHEIGHYLDLHFGGVDYKSNSEEFIEIFSEEKNWMTDSHWKSNSQEYFAESFHYYCENPKSLKYAAPKTFNFINSTVN